MQSNLGIVKGSVGAGRPTTIADEVLDFASSLSQRSELLSAVCNDRLSRISNKHPDPEKQCAEIVKQYPPLFDELRSHMLRIEAALNEISSSIERTEI